MVGLGTLFWQLYAPPPAVQYYQQREKRKSKSLKSPSLFLPEHISSRSCFCSTRVMEQARAVSMENREAPLTDPMSTSSPITAGDLVPLEWAASLRGAPQLQKRTHCWRIPHSKPWEGAVSLLVIYIYRTELLYSYWGEGWGGTSRQKHSLSLQTVPPAISHSHPVSVFIPNLESWKCELQN